MNRSSQESGNTIRLAERRIFSQSFQPLYNEGMGLVEQAAEYLDSRGRTEAKKLTRLPARTAGFLAHLREAFAVTPWRDKA